MGNVIEFRAIAHGVMITDNRFMQYMAALGEAMHQEPAAAVNQKPAAARILFKAQRLMWS